MKTTVWIALSTPMLLAACALEPKRFDVPPETRIIVQPAPPSEVDQLLGHMAKMRKLEPREYTVERDSARNLMLRDKSDFNRIKYALMLMLAPTATSAMINAQDDTEVINLTEPVLSTSGVSNATGESEVRVLASLLHGIAHDRRRMREQLRDSQARLNLAKKDDTRDAEARALRLRVEELEAKLNALKSIDRSVNRRAESPPK